MDAFDDFFAFSDDIRAPAPPKKKKKKVKRAKAEPTANQASVSPVIPGTPTLDKTESVLPEKMAAPKETATHIPAPTEDDYKQEATLTSLLGLSGSTLSEQQDKKEQDKRNIRATSMYSHSNSSFEYVEGMLDRENRRKNVRKDDVAKESYRVEDDDFLNSMTSYVSGLKAKETQIQNLLDTHQREEVTIRGVMYQSNAVKFEFHLDIQAAGQVSGSYDLQVKSATKIGKIINKLMPLFNNEANPQYPEMEWSSLVLYIQKLNIILNPSLKCMSLLGYKSQLAPSNNGAQFEVFGIITTEEYANVLHSEENIKREQKNTADAQNNADSDDIFINIIIEDPQKEATDETIHVDGEVKSEFKETPSNTLSVSQSLLVSELLELYKYKSALPSQLKSTLQHEGKPLDPNKTLEELKLGNKKVCKITYSLEEIEELRNIDINADDDDEDDDDLENIHKDNNTGNDAANDEKQDSEPGFLIYMAGKDNKRYKVTVRPSTKISDIAKFYKEKAGLAADIRLKLVFDDEVLNMNETVAETELEEEVMIDVIIL